MKTSQQIGAAIGSRLARLRLSRNVTQAMLAEDAGIALRTLRRLEAGNPSTLDTFLRVAVALDLGDAILGAIPTGQIRPIERVSRNRFRTPAGTSAATGRSGPDLDLGRRPR